MPNRTDIPGSEGRSFDDAGFRADDERLTADLDRYDRGRSARGYGHDQNYRPGYHEGGARFGFFGQGPAYGAQGPGAPRRAAGDAPLGGPADYGFRPADDQEFDPDYLIWREQQMRRHDRDYADWRREQHRRYDDDYWKFRSERRDDFHQRFQDWRAQREAEANAAAAPPPDDKI